MSDPIFKGEIVRPILTIDIQSIRFASHSFSFARHSLRARHRHSLSHRHGIGKVRQRFLPQVHSQAGLEDGGAPRIPGRCQGRLSRSARSLWRPAARLLTFRSAREITGTVTPSRSQERALAQHGSNSTPSIEVITSMRNGVR